jgi:nicotinate-nucleotide adenylyltransferase
MAKLFFGGSFNPIHVGHLLCARHAAEQLKAGRTVLVPSAQPPHKPGATDLAPADHRVRMCRLAVQGCDGFEVNDLETQRPGPSYTIDTVRALAAQGVSGVRWLIGADMLRNLPSWREPEALMAEAELIVMARPGWSFDWDTLPPPFRKLQENVVEAPLIDISATQIRRRVAAGLPIDFLTPEAVVRHIRETALYRAQGPSSASTPG